MPMAMPMPMLIFLNLFFIRNADSDKINGKDVFGDPLTQLKLIE